MILSNSGTIVPPSRATSWFKTVTHCILSGSSFTKELPNWKRLAQSTVQHFDRGGQRSTSQLRTPRRSEKQQTKRCSNYIYSEHPEHILAPCYRTAPTFAACNAHTKGTFVLAVGDSLALNGDLGVLSAGPRAASQGYTNGERKAIKGKYHDGIKGGYEKTKPPFHSYPHTPLTPDHLHGNQVQPK